MVPEAPIEPTAGGLVPTGEGWFVLNARDAVWLDGHFGAYTRFEGEERFPQLGFNIAVLEPGQPACRYHGENEQEDFLVLSGECLLLIEGEERPLKTWDFVHCPARTEHVLVGAGDGPCAVLAMLRAICSRCRGRSSPSPRRLTAPVPAPHAALWQRVMSRRMPGPPR